MAHLIRRIWFFRGHSLFDFNPFLQFLDIDERSPAEADHREVIQMKFQHGLNNEEIARVLHVTPTAVSKRIRKACSRLKQTLEGGSRNE